MQGYKPEMFKKVFPEEGPHELYITDLFSSSGLKDDLIELPEDRGKSKVMTPPAPLQ
jgi:hypothetical protein